MIEERALDIVKLAKTEETPFYCLDLNLIRKKAKEFVSAWRRVFPSGRIAYSYKTNSLSAVTMIMKECGMLAEVVSGAELVWALSDGFVGEQVLFDGPYKSEAELLEAIEAGVRIQFDSIDELRKILEIAKATGTKPCVSPRLAINLNDRGLSRFGLSILEQGEATSLMKNYGLRFSGLHFHAGSNNPSSQPYLAALELHKELIRDLISQSQQPPWLDIGGGLPASSIGEEGIPFQAMDLANDLMAFFRKENISTEAFIPVVEPGRCLTEDFGVLVTRVVSSKKRGAATYLTLDAGTNSLNSVSKRYHRVAVVANELQRGETMSYRIYGSQCYESDLFGEIENSILDIKVGDLFIYGNSGAYDISNSTAWIRRIPSIFGFEGNGQSLLKRREFYLKSI